MDKELDKLDHFIDIAITLSLDESLSEDVDLIDSLSDADRAAFEALGSPEVVAQRVFAKIQGIADAKKTRDTTYAQHQATSETLPETPLEAVDRGPEFAELLAQHRACHDVERFEWDYRFVKELEEIGQGGQGVVYRVKCEDEFVGSLALKVLSPEPYPDARAYRQDMERMRSVAAVVHQNYPSNLICVEYFASLDGIYVMLMRLIDGFDLQRLLDPAEIEQLRLSVGSERWTDLKKCVFASRGYGQWGLAPGVAVNIIEKCLWGVQTLHEKSIVHCDIKPSNIMLDCYGAIRMIDINSAFQIGLPPKQPSCTPRYAPPEVLLEGKWTIQGDLASLGYVLIELLCGRSSLKGPDINSTSVYALDKQTRIELAEDKRQLYDHVHDLIPEKARQSRCLMDLLKKLIDPNPANRFASAEQAFDQAAKFRDELAAAGLSMPWVKVTKHWVTDVKQAIARAVNRV